MSLTGRRARQARSRDKKPFGFQDDGKPLRNSDQEIHELI